MSNENKIFESICNIMADVDTIGKTKKNKQQGFMFRGIDDVYNHVHSLFAKHKVFSTSEILKSESSEKATKAGGVLFYEKMDIEYTFWAIDGSHVKTQVKGLAMDTADKAANKAMAIGHKYAIIQLLQIPTEDNNDPDSETHQPADSPKKETTHEERAEKLSKYISTLKTNRESWSSWFDGASKEMIDSKYKEWEQHINQV